MGIHVSLCRRHAIHCPYRVQQAFKQLVPDLRQRLFTNQSWCLPVFFFFLQREVDGLVSQRLVYIYVKLRQF
jgi:hypothetical protein